MTDRERRLTEENAVFEEPQNQPEMTSNDRKIKDDKVALDVDEDVDETMAGGLQYPDELPSKDRKS